MADSDSGGIGGDFSVEIKKTGQAITSQVTGATAQKSDSVGASKQVGGFGKSVLSQITGGGSASTGQSQSQDAMEQLGGFGSSILGQVTGSAPAADAPGGKSEPRGFWDELKAFGASALGQVSGQDLQEMKRKDQEFSRASEAEVKARIKRIYAEHAQKGKQEGQYVQEQKKQVEEQKKEYKKQEKKQTMDVQMAQTRANAEVKNLGAE